MPKTKIGVSIEEGLRKELDKIVRDSGYLDLSRSEIVEAVLAAFLKSDLNTTKKARELVIRKRKDKL